MAQNSESPLTRGAAAEEARDRRSGRGLGLGRIKTIFGGEDQPLGRASAIAFTVFAAGAGLSYLAQVVTARIIGPDSYGVYAYVLAWVTLGGYFSTLGLHVTLLRFVPAYQAKAKWGLARGLIRYSQLAAAAVASGVALVGACSILAFGGSMKPELAYTFLLGVATVPFLALHLVSAAAVRAFGGVVTALAPERVIRDSVLLAAVTIAFSGNLCRLDATSAMAATLFASIVMLGVGGISLHWLHPAALDREKPAYQIAEWWQPTLPLMTIMIADNVMSRSGVITLGLAGNTRDAGTFAVAFSMAILTALPRMAVATMFAPTVSALFAREDQAGLQSLIARAACLSLLGTACVGVPLLLLAEPLLAWFGRDFVAGAPVVTILVLGQVFAAACGPQQHLITMTGHERTGAKLVGVCAGANFAASMLVVNTFGMTGAALATTASLIAWNLAMGAFVYNRLHLLPGLIASFKGIPRPKNPVACRI